MMKKNKASAETERRRRSNYGPWLRLVKRVGIVVAVLILGFLLWKNWEKIAPEAILDWTEETFGDAEKGEGFPCKISGSTVTDMQEINQHLVVLSNTSLRFYSSNAAVVAERVHSFTSPTMYTAGKYVLLAELGGSRLRLETRRGTELELVLNGREIYAADVKSNGNIALVLNSTSQSYVSELEVRNAKGEVKFTHKNNKYLLMDVAMSPNGKTVAAVGSTAENGVMKSVLLLITVSNGEVREFADSDVLLHNVSYTSKGAVIAVGDRAIWSLPKNADQPEKHIYNGDELMGHAATASAVSVALRRSGSTDSGSVLVFNAGGKLVQTVDYEGIYRSISAHNSKQVLLTDRSLYEMDATGLIGTVSTPSDSLQATLYRKKPVVLTLSELMRTES